MRDKSDRKILVSGFGSAGKRHVRNAIKIGLMPYVLTDYPDKKTKAYFISRKSSSACFDSVNHAIVASPTDQHLNDVERLANSGIKNFLVEKPLEKNTERAKRILRLAEDKNLNIYVGYNMRYFEVFDAIKKFVRKNRTKIRIVKIEAGYFLPSWKPEKGYTKSYRADREKGGGVDLELSHEIDYAMWLFGRKVKKEIVYRGKISSLKINSPDIAKLILDYKTFVVDITLDFLRREKERFLKIVCENGNTLYCDFAKGFFEINGRTLSKNINMEKTYIKMLKAFLGNCRTGKKKLCTLKEALDVLKILKV